MSPLLSILCATIRINDFKSLITNLEATVNDLASVEVHVKVDQENQDFCNEVELYTKSSKIKIYVYQSPKKEGYWDLWEAYNHMCLFVKGEFIIGLNDQCRFKTKNWDIIIKDYVNAFTDGIFYLRISYRRRFVIRSLVECLPLGESFGFFTKKWIHTTGGWSIGMAAGDTGQECVNYFLRKLYNVNRGIVVDRIEMENELDSICAGAGLSEHSARNKLAKVNSLYSQILDRDFCENYFVKNAALLYIRIQHADNTILDDFDHRMIKVANVDISYSYEYKYIEWVKELIDIDPITKSKRVWGRWAPVVAQQIVARRITTEKIMSLSFNPDSIPENIVQEISLIKRMQIRNFPLTGGESMIIANLVQELSKRHGLTDENTFSKKLMKTAAAKSTDRDSWKYALATSLYLSDNECRSEFINITSLPPCFRSSRINKSRTKAVLFLTNCVISLDLILESFIHLITTKFKSLNYK
jgi:hypothetical protein